MKAGDTYTSDSRCYKCLVVLKFLVKSIEPHRVAGLFHCPKCKKYEPGVIGRDYFNKKFSKEETP